MGCRGNVAGRNLFKVREWKGVDVKHIIYTQQIHSKNDFPL